MYYNLDLYITWHVLLTYSKNMFGYCTLYILYIKNTSFVLISYLIRLFCAKLMVIILIYMYIYLFSNYADVVNRGKYSWDPYNTIVYYIIMVVPNTQTFLMGHPVA